MRNLHSCVEVKKLRLLLTRNLLSLFESTITFRFHHITFIYPIYFILLYVSFAEDFMDAYRDMRSSLGLQGLDEVSRSYFRIF